MNPLSYLYKVGFCDDMINIIYEYVFTGADDRELLILYRTTWLKDFRSYYFSIVNNSMCQLKKFLYTKPVYVSIKDFPNYNTIQYNNMYDQRYFRQELKNEYARERQKLFKNFRKTIQDIENSS